LLNRNFQKFRARERPLFRVLDRNGDGVIDSAEIEQASDTLSACDFNGDGIIDALEIMRAARTLPASLAPHAVDPLPGPFTLLPQVDATPDIVLEVAFDSSDPQRSQLSLATIGDSLELDAGAIAITPQTITLQIGQWPVSFSMVQLKSADGEPGTDQVSVGSVVDGYPLLPELDPNNDGRFTVRELRSIASRLKRFDANQDGRVTTDETAATTRICFGLGPIVHRELSNLRDVPVDATIEIVQGPDWFKRMDRNNDNDLTRSEFLGTDEQFATLDRDGDGLISAAEAIQFEQGAMPESQESQD
jgi:Ca2+-binding EF-hand superfamily protein